MSLSEYQKKRRFSRTPEPAGSPRRSGSRLSFVVQKHAARSLHYDFRLELDGVLKSWAVPKGPSFDPAEKRLAVEVEDHPLEYGHFQGTIPKGEYGAGTVEIWDQGTWTPLVDPHEGLRDGKLDFNLEGERMRGRWKLVRMHGRASRDGKENWLLIKAREEIAPSSSGPPNDGRPVGNKSVAIATGRKSAARNSTLKAVSRQSARKSSRRKESPKHSSNAQVTDVDPAAYPGARRARLPAKIEPELARLVSDAPKGAEWLHEIKLDGYRLICRIDQGQVRLLTRRGLDWTDRFPRIATAAQALKLSTAILDGEAVVLDTHGVSSFQALQTALSEKADARLVYFVFDLLYLDGYDLRDCALGDRKAILAQLLASQAAGATIRLNEHLQDHGPEFLRQCCRHGLEGVVSKHRDRAYRSGRVGDWLKAKCIQREEFVIGGFTEPTASRHGFGALLVGYFERPGHFVYAGRVGTGFSDRVLVELKERLEDAEQRASPFANLTPREAGRGVHWVSPKLVCQVEFTNWTRDHVLRHPSFQGLREDLPATSVVRDAPMPGGLAEDIETEPAKKGSQVAARRAAAGATMRQRKAKKHDPPAHAKAPAGRRLRGSENADVEGVRLTNPDRLVYPDVGITKLALANFYVSIADWALPHIAHRPLSLLRCPDGQGKHCFFQKDLPTWSPSVLRRMTIGSSHGTAQFAVVENAAGLVALVQLGVLEIHPWGSRVDDIEKPDRLTFDLDPAPELAWPSVIRTAHRLRDLLKDAGLTSFVKTTGGKGLHVVAPIARRHSWDEAKAFARAVVERLAREYPTQYLTKASKAARQGKIFLDYLRNDRGATAVAAYSTRARAGAPVSVPLAWEELTPKIHADHFHVSNLPARLKRLARDPWAELGDVWQSITADAKRRVAR